MGHPLGPLNTPNTCLGPALSSAANHAANHVANQAAAIASGSPQPSAIFAAWMTELDGLQALRAHDPAAALQRLAERRPALPPAAPPGTLAAAENTLLRARFAMHTGASHLVLGQHADAGREFGQMEALLAAPELAGASGSLRHHAQRCGIAGANARAVLAHALGDFAAALQAYLDALARARNIGDRRYEAHVLVNLANTFEESGLPAESLEHSRLALLTAQELGMEELVGDIHHNIGNALAASGDAEAGLASNQRGLAAYAALALPQKERYALVAVAERLLELGRLDEAAAALLERQAHDPAFTNQQYEAYAAYLAGRIATAQGAPAAARAAFVRALAISEGELADRVGQARARLELASLDLAEGHADSARALAQTAADLLHSSQAQRDLMRAHRLLGRISKAQGDLAAALHHHELFHEGYERCFNEESARKARLLAVRHEVDMSQAEAQRQRLENARLAEALAEIGARLQLGEGRAVPAEPGLPAKPADLVALGLTPREAEVLFWVTQGKTNEDVMEILGSSLSAVKKHLGRIYEKLGVENRTAAANAARRRSG